MITISFVIPLYNEEKSLNTLTNALKKLELPFGLKLDEIIFVDDGSSDRSKSMLSSVIASKAKQSPDGIATGSENPRNDNIAEKVKLISYEENMGKGYAVKQGILASTSDYTFFFDADLSTPLSEIKKFLPLMQKNIDVIVGTRKNGGSTVIKSQPVYRQLLGRGFTLLSNTILGTSFTDFTCGFKAFSKNSKDKIFKQTLINRWGFDSEVLFLTKKIGFSFKEVAVVWKNDENSKVNILLDAPRSFFELILIRLFNLNLKSAGFLIRALKYTYLNL